jgi:succinate dehydrogenase / fumarate reductase membrane anchor subunit
MGFCLDEQWRNVMLLRSPLARVRGLGSARAGTEEFIKQRLAAMALVPLLLWFVYSIIHLATADHATVVQWIRLPWNTVGLILLFLVLFQHAYSGLREVVEDYIHQEVVKTISMVAMNFGVITITVGCVFAILRIALGG